MRMSMRMLSRTRRGAIPAAEDGDGAASSRDSQDTKSTTMATTTENIDKSGRVELRVSERWLIRGDTSKTLVVIIIIFQRRVKSLGLLCCLLTCTTRCIELTRLQRRSEEAETKPTQVQVQVQREAEAEEGGKSAKWSPGKGLRAAAHRRRPPGHHTDENIVAQMMQDEERKLATTKLATATATTKLPTTKLATASWRQPSWEEQRSRRPCHHAATWRRCAGEKRHPALPRRRRHRRDALGRCLEPRPTFDRRKSLPLQIQCE